MSESLLADVESTPSEESTTETTESTWAYAEGIAGEGDKPDWFKGDKFKSVSDQAAAYKSLESKLGGFTGAPDEYELSFPEGIEGDWIEGDPLMENFQNWAKENQLNQEAFTGLLHMYLENESKTMGSSRESELAALGKDAKARLQNIHDFGKANLSESEFEGLLVATNTAAGVQAIEALIAKTRGLGIPKDDSDTSTGVTHAEIKERMNDPRYQSDPAFRKETSRMYERLFGNEPKRDVIG